MRIVFMGTPEFAVPALEHLVLNNYQVAAVYTQPDRPAGRGKNLVAPPIKKSALRWQLPVVQPDSLKTAGEAERLAEFNPDVIVVAALGQILPKAVLEIPRYGCINIHPSLLPRYRGASPVAAALLVGDEFSGVSIMLLDEGMDTGPILVQAAVPVFPGDNAGSLGARLSLISAHLLQEALLRWVRKEIMPRPQDESKAIYCEPISKEQGEIDWQRPAVEIWRQVRAYYPWPGSYTHWQGRQLKIISAEPLPGRDSLKVGQVAAINDKGKEFGIQTGDGLLAVYRVQLQGKRDMPAGDFLRGQRGFIGAVLPC